MYKAAALKQLTLKIYNKHLLIILLRQRLINLYKRLLVSYFKDTALGKASFPDTAFQRLIKLTGTGGSNIQSSSSSSCSSSSSIASGCVNNGGDERINNGDGSYNAGGGTSGGVGCPAGRR